MNEHTEKLIEGCQDCVFGYGIMEWTRCRILGRDVSEYERENNCYPSDCPAIKGILVRINQS